MDETNPEDFYSDSESNSAPESETKTEAEKVESGDQTALLPKAVFMGKDLEIGKECKFKIVGIHDGEVSVEYVSHADKKKESKPETDREMADLME